MSTTSLYPVNAKYAEHAQVATQAVLRAAFITTKVQQGIKERKADTEEKPDKSPVTVADYASQAVLSHLLSLSFPSFSLIGEEDTTSLRSNKEMTSTIVGLVNDALALDSEDVGGKPAAEKLTEEQVLNAIDRGNAEGGKHGEFWTCDPIDGTLGFLRGEQYAICLTLISSSLPVLGLIACPNLPFPSLSSPSSTGSLFLASTSSGAFQSPLPTQNTPLHFTPIHTSPALSPPYKILESVESSHSSHSINAEIASQLGGEKGEKLDSVRMDSQAKYGALARGDADLYLRVPTKFSGGKEYTEKIWDHASGELLVKEAGGKVGDVWGRALDFGKGRMLSANEGVIATASGVHSAALTAVRTAIVSANPKISPPSDEIAESITADDAVADEIKEAEAKNSGVEKGKDGQVIGEEMARPTS